MSNKLTPEKVIGIAAAVQAIVSAVKAIASLFKRRKR